MSISEVFARLIVDATVISVAPFDALQEKISRVETRSKARTILANSLPVIGLPR